MTIDNSKAVEAFYKAETERQVRLDYPLNEKSVVLDLGAYKGEWALQIKQRYSCRIEAFEPVPELAQQAAKNLGSEVWAFGVGGTSRTEQIVVDNDGSNFFATTGNKINVKVASIDEVFDLLSIKHVDLIKMNVEGAEFEVLERIVELGWIERFTDFQIQFHPVVPNYDERRKDIQKELYKTHWQTYNFEWVWENWRKR